MYTYICIYIYIFSIDNYIQVMTHRIYSFPLGTEGKQIHTQFTEEVPLRDQPDRSQGPSCGWGWDSSRNHDSYTVAYCGGWAGDDAKGQACSAWAGGRQAMFLGWDELGGIPGNLIYPGASQIWDS